MWPLAANRGCFDVGAPQDGAMQARFLQDCNRGMIFHGDYSGAEFAREAMQRLKVCLHKGPILDIFADTLAKFVDGTCGWWCSGWSSNREAGPMN